MKREKNIMFLYISSLLLIIGFIIRIISDYLKYNPMFDSAPFSTFVLVRAIEFVVPSLIILVIALILQKRIK